MLKEENKEYLILLDDLKSKIVFSQQEIVTAANKELLMLYWEIGNSIVEKQEEQQWEVTIINDLTNDLKKEFCYGQNFLEKNLKYMCKFVKDYKSLEFVEKVASKISWEYHIILMDKIENIKSRVNYINKIIENGWSKNELLEEIALEYDSEEDKIIQNEVAENDKINSENETNAEAEIDKNNIKEDDDNIFFKEILGEVSNELPGYLLKDSYIADFLNFSQDAKERNLEKQLIKCVMEYFLNLGKGFAFLGSKYHLQVDNEDYYVDMLFYNIKLKCYLAVELKVGSFKPMYLGNLSFYLSLIDDTVKCNEDRPTIGLILCKDDDKLIVQYAFKEDASSFGNSEYSLTEDIPSEFKENLPTVKEIGTGIKEDLKD